MRDAGPCSPLSEATGRWSRPQGGAALVSVIHGGVIAQVWRGGHGRQAPLARTVPGLHIVALDGALGRRAGVLLGEVGASEPSTPPS